MASKNFLSGDYVSRRGAVLTPSGIENSPTQTSTYDASNVILGQDGLSKSFYSHTDFFFAKQMLMSKGMDDTTSSVMAASLLDVAKLKQINIQIVMQKLFDGVTKLLNEFTDSTIKCSKHGFKTTEAVHFTPRVRTEQGTSLPTGIDEFEDSGVPRKYYIINVNNDNFKVADSELNARRGVFVELTTAQVVGAFEVHKSHDLRLDMDQYIHMNFVRPTTNQLGIMVRNELKDSVRYKQINP